MTDRGNYRVRVALRVEREINVLAGDLDEAEEKAKKEAVSLTGGTDPEVLWLHQEK